jgi:hypothetical protein
MISTVFKILKNAKFKSEPPLPLGRWHHDCEKAQALKALHATHDSCGDYLCGTPLFVKNIVNNEDSKSDEKIEDYDLEVNPYLID